MHACPQPPQQWLLYVAELSSTAGVQQVSCNSCRDKKRHHRHIYSFAPLKGRFLGETYGSATCTAPRGSYRFNKHLCLAC